MAVLKCKMCGGDLEIIEGSNICVCQYCETRQTVPTMDNDKKLTLFARANRLRYNCEFDKAYSVYEAIIAEFSEEAEAYWGLVLCKYGVEYVDDPKTAKKIPTCHRSSFDSVMDDENFDRACEYAGIEARALYREEAKQIEELRRGIIEISSSQDPYDIFICYKETDVNGNRTMDSVIAQDVYEALTRKGYKVFFSRISLEDKLGREYEPYIFSALHSAKIMLVFGTDYEHFNAVWVKNEWSRFLKLMEEDEQRALIPCFKGIDAYDMPKEFVHLQSQDMGKLGAIQDLLRGIEKILDSDKKEETVIIQASGNDEKTVSALLKRANTFLKCKDYIKADQYFEKVLDVSPNNEEALIGKLLVELQVDSLEELKKLQHLFHNSKNYKYLILCCKSETKKQVNDILNKIKEDFLNEAQKAIKNRCFKQAEKICDKVLDFEYENEKALLYKLLICFEATGIEELASGTIIFDCSEEYQRLIKMCNANLKEKLINSSNKVRENLTLRIKQALNQKNFSVADSLCNEVLKYDKENENALIGKFFVYYGASSLKELEYENEDFSDSVVYKNLLKNCSIETKKKFENSLAIIKNNIEQKRKENKRLIKIAIIVVGIIVAIGLIVFAVYSQTPKYIWGLEENADGLVITRFRGNNRIENGHLEIPAEIDGKPVVKIGNCAFEECDFSSVTIPNSVTYIGSGAFMYCRKLKSVSIPKEIVSIEPRTFQNCVSLTTVEIPDSVTSIGDYAFSSCWELENIEIPNGIAEISNSAFDGTKSFNNYDNANYVGNKENPYLVLVKARNDDIKSCVINENTKFICNNAFDFCDITSITIPNSVISIGEKAFYYCGELTSVKIGESVTEIGYGAFKDCWNLTELEIGSNVEYIGSFAFSGCLSLEEIFIPISVEIMGYDVFSDCYKLTIYCEASSQPKGWSGWNYSVRSVVWSSKKFFGITSDGIKWRLTSENEIKILDYIGTLKEITIPEEIDNYKVTSIEEQAFYNCKSLTSIVIPNSVTSIGRWALYDCSSLVNIFVDENNPNYCDIDGNLYTKDKRELIQYATGKSASKFSIPNGVTIIGVGAFFGCSNLTTVEIPNSVTEIFAGAFENCTSLTSIKIPKSVTLMGYYVFENCTSLTIYCEASSRPLLWGEQWNNSNCPVIWGYKGN